MVKVGQIGTLRLGQQFGKDYQGAWAKIKIIEIEGDEVWFETIERSKGWLWDNLIGLHMFEDGNFGTWNVKEDTVKRILDKLDE